MNLRPSAPKADALPSCATPRIQFHRHWFAAVELPEGFEPSTVRLQGGCSAVELEQHRRPRFTVSRSSFPSGGCPYSHLSGVGEVLPTWINVAVAGLVRNCWEPVFQLSRSQDVWGGENPQAPCETWGQLPYPTRSGTTSLEPRSNTPGRGRFLNLPCQLPSSATAASTSA